MTHDLKITGAAIVDGTGAAPFTGDVAVRDGIIVEVGKVTGAAKREIRADGALVTPGFIDAHTHYDGQATWDSDLHPSSRHGVTTAIMGNCGVGFAPLKPGEQERLVALMSGVEDIPGSVLAEGMRWNWRTFGDYLDALDAIPHTVNLAAQVTHGPLRLYAMGERAMRYERATGDDIALMQEMLREGLMAGAVGFSSGRISSHRMLGGGVTPDCDAEHDEVVALASVLRGLPHRVLHVATDFDLHLGPEAFDAEFDLLERMCRTAQRPLSMNLLDRAGSPTQWRDTMRRTEAANAAGLNMRMQAASRGIGMIMGLSATLHPFSGQPSCQAIADLPLREQVQRMRDPAFCARALAEKPNLLCGPDSTLPPFWEDFFANLERTADRIFTMTDNPDSEPAPETSVGARARAEGRPPLEVLYDWVVQDDDGRSLLYFPFYNFTPGNLSAVHEMLMNRYAIMGAGDAGAHVGIICDNAFPTFCLSFWRRDRTAGPKIATERLVHLMSGAIASHFGFTDRGRIAPGLRADLNVVDPDRIRLHSLRVAQDLPAGGKRLLQDSDGYIATLVGGTAIAEHDALTGARPGRLYRAART
jgi:N-acyl-D-aspartate/D-glutamate deacylase